MLQSYYGITNFRKISLLNKKIIVITYYTKFKLYSYSVISLLTSYFINEIILTSNITFVACDFIFASQCVLFYILIILNTLYSFL